MDDDSLPLNPADEVPSSTLVDGTAEEIPPPRDGKPVKVVGVGASAGGLEALEILFSHMPNDTGMAFVVIQHLSPDFRSVMDELLARRTQMQVRMAEEGMQVERDTVYLMPRKTQMRIVEGALRLADQEQGKALLLPIDTFFQSLAEDCGERGVGVVLSGTGSDGSRGVRAIHERGGLVFAQSEESAKFDGMPRAAIETEIVDFVLPPERMPEVLLAYSGVGGLAGVEGVVKLEETEFSAIFELLKQHHGLDFHAYKPTTMRRRIERRMVLRQVRDLEAYAELLRRESDEIEALYIDLLIGVTRFFRDEAAFARIEHEVLPRLVESKDPREEIRAWVCGCATGEEAYSIAMLLKEAALQYGHDGSVKVFATDVHRRTLDRAARGVFSAESLRAVPDHLRDKYFVKDGESYRVTTELRQVVVFSEHNLTGDPPFTKIDLVSCRNLLIYLQSAAQRKAIALFHFALNVNGVLMLGPSESLGALEDEFELVDRTWKIYGKKREGRIFAGMRERPPAISTGKMVLPSVGGSRSTLDSRLARAYDQLLAHYMPPSLLVDESRRLLHTFGEVGRFFVRPEGRPSLDLIDMLTGDLRVAVAAALQRSIKEGRKVTYQGIAYEPEGGSRERLNLVIEPLEDRISSGKLYHLLFDGGPSPKAPETLAEDEVVQDFASSGEATLERIRNLELELQYSKQHLQTTVEELETSNEELQATNEELLASNEELQSTNEELHSVNEELYTVNAEYEKKNRELLELNNDIDNLLRSTEIGTLFLDENLLVRKFTPSIRAAFNLLPQDIGRSIVDITYRVKGHETLWEDASEVLHEGSSLDRKVRSLEGRDLLLRLRPYRTSTPGPGGVVLTFVDITELSRAQRELAESESRFRRITDSTPALFWLVDRDFAGEHFNAHWTELTGLPLEDLQREGWHRFIEAEDREALFAQCQSARAARERIGAEVRLHTAEGAQRWIRVTGSPRFLDENVPNGFVFSAVDIDDIRNAADRLRERVNERTRELRESEEFFRQVGEIATDGFWDLDLPTGKLYLSPSFKALFGYADETVPETLEGWERFVHPDDREPLRRALRDHLEEGAPYNLPVRYQHREGHWIWVLRRGVAIRQEDGQFRRMIGTHTDITALKETEVELARSRDRFRNVFETSIMGIGIVDRELRLTEANECLLKLIGRERAALPLPLPEISDEAGTELSKRLVREALSAGASSIAEKVYRRPDGHLVVARIGYGRLNRDSDDLVVIAEDITAAVESREALALSEARLTQAIEATEVGLFDWSDPLGAGVVHVSPEFFRTLGMEAEETAMPAARLAEVLGERNWQRLQGAIVEAGKDGTSVDLDLQVPTADGFSRWAYLRGRVQRDGARLLGSVQDVTDRYAAQASLQLKTELLEKSNRDLEQFAYIASHDLKEPLRTVTVFLQMLEDRYGTTLGEDGGDFVHRAIAAAERMHALINGLLEFSRIGRAKPATGRIALGEAADVAVSQLQAAIREKGASVTVDELPEVTGDLTLIARVFQNILGNAIKFTDGEPPVVRVYAETRDNHVRVYFEDNGIGIDPKFAERVFVIFQRLHTQDEYPGTGIGLAVCRKIMEVHHGCIWLEPRAEGQRGSTLGLAFPRLVKP